MDYIRNNTRDKWTIMMYMRDFELMAIYAYALRESNDLSTENIDEILAKMEADGIYHPRNGGSTFTGNFKAIQIAWYMFGYYKKNSRASEGKKLVFTPLGNLLLDNIKDRERARLIFLTMLYGIGFRHPFSQMDARFNIFGFRLIFKLLRDDRLGGKLYDDEVFYYVMFVKSISPDEYEQLVEDILALREKLSSDKYAEFKRNEHILGLACHEWRYAVGMLQSAGVLDVREGVYVGNLTYGNINPKTGRPNAIRKYYTNYVSLNDEVVELLDSLLSSYPYYEKPYPEDDLETKFSSSKVIEMYSFYPNELLVALGIDNNTDKAIASMLKIASDINYYSREEVNTGCNFECALTDAFNMFMDVEAERIGGSGNTDVECIYIRNNSDRKKFDIEAKSTSTKLGSINPIRLARHRSLIGSRYTIIVAPSYAIGVLSDIENDKSVIIKASTLANYFYQYISKNGRNISYAVLDEIVEANVGKDITDSVNSYVYSNFGHSFTD